MPYSNIVFLTSASTSPWTIDATYNPADSKIECIGRGGNGAARNDASTGGNSGGGGAYAVKTNVNLGSGSAAFQVGSSASAVVTFIKDSGGTIQVQADYGRDAVNGSTAPGGASANCIPTTGANGGGTSPNQPSGSAANGLGGSGAGGPNGIGSSAISGITFAGANADGGTVTGPSTQGAVGNSGTEWDATHGCGTGGAGGDGGGSRNGGAGGSYGGGGGGGNKGASAVGGAGTSGLIVIQWNPATTPLGDMIAQQPLQPPGYKW